MQTRTIIFKYPQPLTIKVKREMTETKKEYPCSRIQDCEIPFVLTNLIVLYNRLHLTNFIAEPTKANLRIKYAELKKIVEATMPDSYLDKRIIKAGIASSDDPQRDFTTRKYMQGIESKLNHFHH